MAPRFDPRGAIAIHQNPYRGFALINADCISELLVRHSELDGLIIRIGSHNPK